MNIPKRTYFGNFNGYSGFILTPEPLEIMNIPPINESSNYGSKGRLNLSENTISLVNGSIPTLLAIFKWRVVTK
jgi:hypothetical protein